MKKIFIIITFLLPFFTACNDIESLEENVQKTEENNLMDGELSKKKLKVKPRWKQVKEISGKETLETRPFKIKGKEWQIKWSVKENGDEPEFILILYDKNDPSFTEVIANTDEAENDFAYLEGKGEYYLAVNAKNVRYKVTIEEVK